MFESDGVSISGETFFPDSGMRDLLLADFDNDTRIDVLVSVLSPSVDLLQWRHFKNNGLEAGEDRFKNGPCVSMCNITKLFYQKILLVLSRVRCFGDVDKKTNV